MLIDISGLDDQKTYIVLEISSSTTARKLQFLQHAKIKDFKKEDISSHALGLVHRENGWHVWECHLKWGGIREYPLVLYELENLNSSVKRVLVYEYPLNIEAMDYWKKNNPGYSVLDLGKITANRLIGLKLPNTPGMVCSEALANCGHRICNKLNLKTEYVCPVDFQKYFASTSMEKAG